MNFKRIGRILVCLVLICALVVNISPIKAQAAVPMSAMLIPVGMAIVSWLIGLGVQAIQDNPEPFQGVVNAASSALEAAGYVVNGMVSVYNLSGGGYYVKQEVLDFLHNWVFDNGVVAPAIPDLSDVHQSLYDAAFNEYCSTFGYSSAHVLFCFSNSDAHSVYFSQYPFTLSGDKYYCYSGTTQMSFKRYYIYSDRYESAVGTTKSAWPGIDGTYLFNSDEPWVVQEGIALGHVATPDDGLDGYPSWVPSMVTIDGVETSVYPFGLGQTEEETKGFTQEQVWSGESTYTQEEIEGTTQHQITVQGLDTHFYELGTKLAQWFSELTAGVTSIPQQILDGLGQILIDVLSYLFVPRQEFAQAKVQALTQEFAFAGSIVNTCKAITTGLSGITTEPPVIYIDLGANRGSHYLGGKVPFLDLRWYAEYKATVDTLISAFLWICFVWRMLLKLPGIIGGMPGDFVYGAAHTLGLDSHLPTRNAAYEVTRAANREYIRKGPGK